MPLTGYCLYRLTAVRQSQLRAIAVYTGKLPATVNFPYAAHRKTIAALAAQLGIPTAPTMRLLDYALNRAMSQDHRRPTDLSARGALPALLGDLLTRAA